MIIVAWVFLVLGILVNSVVSILIQIQVNEKLPQDERFSWWGHQSLDVGRKHRLLYPESVLPDLQIALLVGTVGLGLALFFFSPHGSSTPSQ
jgi:hypothetical protein